jgi:4-oxalomesaconate hydratase
VALNRGIQGSRNTGVPMTYGEAYQTLFPRVVTDTLG